MQKIRTKLILLSAISLFALNFTSGCAHKEKSPPERNTGWLYIHEPLPEASRKIDEARAAGKDRQCPAEFKDAKDTVDNAYATYVACRTKEAIAMAEDGINKANALCPPPAAVAPPPAAKTVVFAEAALFDVDRAELKPEGKQQIEAYREQARSELSRADRIIITGHTDNTGSTEHNMELSLRRAEALRTYLASLGVDPMKMEVKGAGETQPVADNSTSAGRAKNRRVEVQVVGLER